MRILSTGMAKFILAAGLVSALLWGHSNTVRVTGGIVVVLIALAAWSAGLKAAQLKAQQLKAQQGEASGTAADGVDPAAAQRAMAQVVRDAARRWPAIAWLVAASIFFVMILTGRGPWVS